MSQSVWFLSTGAIVSRKLKSDFSKFAAPELSCGIMADVLNDQCYSMLFRCTSGIEGLKEQGVTNYITSTFIMKYDVLFLDLNETSPHSSDFVLVSFIITLFKRCS